MKLEDGLAKNGESDFKNSLEGLLIDWITKDDNYMCYRGQDKKGRSKSHFHKEIAAMLNSSGVGMPTPLEKYQIN